MHGHLTVYFADNADFIPSGIGADISRKGESLKEGASFVRDGDSLSSVGAEEEHLEVIEPDVYEWLAEVAAAFEQLADIILELKAGKPGCLDLAKDWELDVAIGIHKIGIIT